MKRNQAAIIDTTKWGDQSGMNITFRVEANGFIGNFRIHYSDESRKNAKYSNLKAITAYFETADNRPNAYNTYPIQDTVNAMMFVERKMQWILEFVMNAHQGIRFGKENEEVRTETDMI